MDSVLFKLTPWPTIAIYRQSTRERKTKIYELNQLGIACRRKLKMRITQLPDMGMENTTQKEKAQ